jgi:hypothetical protein
MVGGLFRGDPTYFTMNLQNHRQCPAGGFSFSSSFDRLPAKDRTGVLTGSVHHSCIIFFIFPVVFTSSKRFALHNVALASLPRASGSFGLNFASPPVVHLPFRNKSASAKGKVGVSGGGVRPLAAETSNWRSGPLERGGIFVFRSALRLARDAGSRASWVSVGSP